MNGKRKVNFIYSVCLFTAVWTINLFALDAHGLGVLNEYVMGDHARNGLGRDGIAFIGDIDSNGVKDIITGKMYDAGNSGTLVITPLEQTGKFLPEHSQILQAPNASAVLFGHSIEVLKEVEKGHCGHLVTAAETRGVLYFLELCADASGSVSIADYFVLDTSYAQLSSYGYAWNNSHLGHDIALIQTNGNAYLLAAGAPRKDRLVLLTADFDTKKITVHSVLDGVSDLPGIVSSGDHFGSSVAPINDNGAYFSIAVGSQDANGGYGEIITLHFDTAYSITGSQEFKLSDMPSGFLTGTYYMVYSIESADLDYDGNLDLILGSTGFNPTNLNPEVDYAGALNILFLNAQNDIKNADVFPIYKGSTGGLIDSNHVVRSASFYYGYQFGSRIATADFDHDGMTDLLVGSAAHNDYGGIWTLKMKSRPFCVTNVDTLTLSAASATWQTRLDLDTIFSGNKPEYRIINTYDTTIAQCMTAKNLLKCKPGANADKIRLVLEASDTSDPSGIKAYSAMDSMVVKVIVGNSLPVSLLPDTLYLQEEFSDTLLNLSQYFTDTDSLSYTEKIIDDVLFTNSLVGTTITLKSLSNRAGISRLELGADDGISTTFDTVYISIENVQDPPVAVDDSLTMAEDGSEQTLDVLANDFDADARDTLSLCDTLMVYNGAKASISSGLLNYQPAADFFGKDSVKYGITDGIDSTWAWVRIEVTPINDLPRLQNPIGTLTLDVDSGTVYVPLDSVFAEVDWDKGGSMTLASECDDYADVFRELLHHGDLSITPLRSFTGSCKIILNFQGDVAGEFARDTLSLFIKKESSSVAVNAAEKLLRGAGNNQNLIDAENGTLFLSPSASGRIVRVYDVFGREFLQKSISEKGESIHLSPGIWLVRVEGINQTVKVVVGQYGTF